MVSDVRGARMAVHSIPKLGLSGEILRVVLDSSETDRGLYLLLVC